MSWFIVIVRLSDSGVEHEIGPYHSVRHAAQAERGVLRNLDRSAYFTRITADSNQPSGGPTAGGSSGNPLDAYVEGYDD